MRASGSGTSPGEERVDAAERPRPVGVRHLGGRHPRVPRGPVHVAEVDDDEVGGVERLVRLPQVGADVGPEALRLGRLGEEQLVACDGAAVDHAPASTAASAAGR